MLSAIVVLLVAILLVLSYVAFGVGQLTASVEAIRRLLLLTIPRDDTHVSSQLSNFAIWTYEGGAWRLMEDHSARGMGPPAPPQRPGFYEGETVRKPLSHQAP